MFYQHPTNLLDRRQTMTPDETSLASCQEGGPVPVGGIADVLQALADPARLAMVRRLADCGAPITCGSFDLPLHKSTLSHHFKVLREAGLIEQRCQGTWRMTSLRRAEVDALYPGLLDSILQAPVAEPAAR
jgi:DNA-binding transcriptional ArsR family regulator